MMKKEINEREKKRKIHISNERVTHSVEILNGLGTELRSLELKEKSIRPSTTVTPKHSLSSALLQCHAAV